MLRSKRILASLFASALLVTVIMAPVAQAQDQDGLVNVNIENVLNNNDINVVVPIQAAIALAANVCNVSVDAAVLGTIDDGGDDFNTTCESTSRAFNEGELTISNN